MFWRILIHSGSKCTGVPFQFQGIRGRPCFRFCSAMPLVPLLKGIPPEVSVERWLSPYYNDMDVSTGERHMTRTHILKDPAVQPPETWPVALVFLLWDKIQIQTTVRNTCVTMDYYKAYCIIVNTRVEKWAPSMCPVTISTLHSPPKMTPLLPDFYTDHNFASLYSFSTGEHPWMPQLGLNHFLKCNVSFQSLCIRGSLPPFSFPYLLKNLSHLSWGFRIGQLTKKTGK